MFGLFTGIAVLQFGYHYLDDLARGHQGTLATKFIEEFTGVYTRSCAPPVPGRADAAVSLERSQLAGRIAVQAGGAVVFSLAHTTLMALTRQVLFPLFGLGPIRLWVR